MVAADALGRRVHGRPGDGRPRHAGHRGGRRPGRGGGRRAGRARHLHRAPLAARGRAALESARRRTRSSPAPGRSAATPPCASTTPNARLVCSPTTRCSRRAPRPGRRAALRRPTGRRVVLRHARRRACRADQADHDAGRPFGRAAVCPSIARVAGEVLVRGLGASPGIAAGLVRVLSTPAEGGQLVAGEVLVAPMTNPDWLPTLRRAAAVVTDGGGITCHAAIVSRELGVPCVVGTHDATSRLHDGHEVTVDGARRHGDRGCDRTSRRPRCTWRSRGGRGSLVSDPVTATKLYVNLALAERAAEVAAGAGRRRRAAAGRVPDVRGARRPAPSAGAGHRRARGVPRRGWRRRCSRSRGPSQPRPVVYRTIDFRTNEFRGLEGGERVRAGGAEPDDRLPRLLPVRARARPVRPRAGAAGAGPRGDAATCIS